MEERYLKIYKCESCTFSSASDSIDDFGRFCYKLKRKVPLNFLIDADCPLPKALSGSGQNSAELAEAIEVVDGYISYESQEEQEAWELIKANSLPSGVTAASVYSCC